MASSQPEPALKITSASATSTVCGSGGIRSITEVVPRRRPDSAGCQRSTTGEARWTCWQEHLALRTAQRDRDHQGTLPSQLLVSATCTPRAVAGTAAPRPSPWRTVTSFGHEWRPPAPRRASVPGSPPGRCEGAPSRSPVHPGRRPGCCRARPACPAVGVSARPGRVIVGVTVGAEGMASCSLSAPAKQSDRPVRIEALAQADASVGEHPLAGLVQFAVRKIDKNEDWLGRLGCADIRFPSRACDLPRWPCRPCAGPRSRRSGRAP